MELANAERVVKTDPLLENFVQRTQQFDTPQSRSKYIQKLIQAKMHQLGYTYDQAWNEIKEERPDLIKM